MKPKRCDLFWWMGVLNTDCYIYRKDGKIKELRLRVGTGSLEMLVKWKTILDSITGKEHIISKEVYHDKRYNKDRESFCVRESSKTVIETIIEELPNTDFMKNNEFGAYLAGIIDGDGCIQIRKRYADSGYERLVKIVGETQNSLVKLQNMFIKKRLPKGYITEYGNHCDMWIYINKEFGGWLTANVAPHMSIKRKSRNLTPKTCLETDAICPGSEQRSPRCPPNVAA
jgi:hypothetical protein